MKKRKIIVLSSIRNEDWIIEPFLRTVTTFADDVVILDQSDENNEIKLKSIFPKLIYLRNTTKSLNEQYRQEKLIKEARRISNNAILIMLDADEFFNEKFYSYKFQARLQELEPGYGMRFKMLNVYSNFEKAWQVQMNPIIYVDDGAPFVYNRKIHNYRLPFQSNRIKEVSDVAVYHFQFLDWARMLSKHRWYQAVEKIYDPNKANIEIYRLYNHMHIIPSRSVILMDKSDFKSYSPRRIDLTREIDYSSKESYWWDEEVLNLIRSNKQINFNYLEAFDSMVSKISTPKLNLRERQIRYYLAFTHRFTYPGRFNVLRYFIRLIDKILGLIE